MIHGYKLTDKGRKVLLSHCIVPEGLAVPPNSTFHGTSLIASALAELFYDTLEENGDSYCLYESDCLDNKITPLAVMQLEQSGYIEESVIPVLESYLEHQERRKRRGGYGKWFRMGLEPPEED